jgi:hypothetical protein
MVPNKGGREKILERLKLRQFWSEVFGWVVGVGLVIEYWHEIVDCFVHRHWPSLSLIGGLLVTAGVLGEVLFSKLVLFASDELQERSDSDVAQANERAAQALERAGKAEQATAELQIAVADARERQVKAEERLSKLQLPRAVTFDIDKCVSLLRERNIVGNAEILYQPEDGEAAFFSAALRAALRSAGWIVRQPVPAPSVPSGQLPAITMLGGIMSGVGLVTHEISDDNPASVLHDVLHQCGVSSGWKSDTDLPVGIVRLVVAPKL